MRPQKKGAGKTQERKKLKSTNMAETKAIIEIESKRDSQACSLTHLFMDGDSIKGDSMLYLVKTRKIER